MKNLKYNDKLLYFPYINIPNTEWTTRSILYWDKVGAIVPQIYIHNPDELQSYMRKLIELDLVEQVFPGNYIHDQRDFDQPLLSLINQPNFNLMERQTAFRNSMFMPIHVQKFDEILLNELKVMGIAKRQNRDWYLVETKTAKLLMIYLATIIGAKGNFTPATDNPNNIDFTIQQDGLSYYLQKTRGRLLKDLMPFPLNPDLDKLKHFKEKHEKQLKQFRILLELVIYKISKIKDKDERDYFYQLKVAEINQRKEEISRKLTEKNVGKIVFGSIFGLIVAVGAIATGNTWVVPFAFGKEVYRALQGYGNDEVLSRDYSYLALVGKHFRRR